MPGVRGFHADVAQSRLYVSFVSTALSWDAGVTVPIPGLPDATVGVAPDLTSNGTVFQFSIPLSSIRAPSLPGAGLPWAGLPDGRPLPGVRSGALPRWDFQIDRLRASAYVAEDVFGLFLPLALTTRTGLKLPFVVSMNVRDERGNAIGKAYAVPALSSREESGLLLLLSYLGGSP